MNELLRFTLLGLATGAMYALSAQGLILIYRGSGVLNFAHGAMAMISAFMFYDLAYEMDLPKWLAILGGLLTGTLLGLLMHVVFMRRLRNSSPIMRLIATLGVMAVLQSIAALRYGVNPKIVQGLFPTDLVKFGEGIVITADRLWLIAIACVATVVLWAVYKYTRFGIATTATAENQRSAAATGWSPDRVAAINWMLGGALAAGAGILLAPIVSIQVTVLTTVVVAAFAGALIANFTSFPVALLGGLAVGIAESLMARYVTVPGLGSSAPFLVIVAVLALRGRSLPVRGEFLDRLPSIGSGRVRMRVVVPLLVIQAALLLFVFNSTAVGHWTISMVYAIILLSIVVLTGYAGQLSLAQVAMAGVGALIAARLIATFDFPFLPALLVGAALVVPLGMVVALPALRTRGASLAVATLGVGLAVQYILFGNPEVTGSATGTSHIGIQSIFGIEISAVRDPVRYSILALIALTLVALMVASVRRSRAGRRLIAVRDNERAAAALGVNVTSAKLYAFGLAALIAALGGGLLALQGAQVQYEQFTFMASISVVLWAVVGGIGYIGGAMLGATLAPGGIGSFIMDEIFGTADGYIELIGGVLLLAMIMLNPDGMASENIKFGKAIGRLLRRLRRSEEAAGETTGATGPVQEAAIGAGERHIPGQLGIPLEVQGVTVRFGGVTAVDNVSLVVHPGRVHGLIGPNGAGKTTLVDAITGFVRPSAGELKLDGKSILQLPPHARSRLGVIRSFQSLELFEDMTIRENLDTACDQNRMGEWFSSLVGGGKAHLSDTALAAIKVFDLASDLDRLPSELPYGRRRLAGIARAVAAAPKVLLLDEPAAGLDDAETRELGQLIRALAEQWGLSILLIEHHVDLVMEVCDEVSVLNFGKLIAHGTPAEIRNNEQVRIAYLGEVSSSPQESVTNVVMGDVR